MKKTGYGFSMISINYDMITLIFTMEKAMSVSVQIKKKLNYLQ